MKKEDVPDFHLKMAKILDLAPEIYGMESLEELEAELLEEARRDVRYSIYFRRLFNEDGALVDLKREFSRVIEELERARDTLGKISEEGHEEFWKAADG